MGMNTTGMNTSSYYSRLRSDRSGYHMQGTRLRRLVSDVLLLVLCIEPCLSLFPFRSRTNRPTWCLRWAIEKGAVAS